MVYISHLPDLEPKLKGGERKVDTIEYMPSSKASHLVILGAHAFSHDTAQLPAKVFSFTSISFHTKAWSTLSKHSPSAKRRPSFSMKDNTWL